MNTDTNLRYIAHFTFTGRSYHNVASFRITPQVKTMASQTNTQRPACQKVRLIGTTLNCTESHGSHSTGFAIAIAAS